jgi:aldose 1-epimerase
MLKSVQMDTTSFGTTKDGTEVELITLRNKNGLLAKFTTYGATLVELHVPDRSGKLGNIVLGFDSVAPYQLKTNPHFGGTIGRYANRIGGAQFKLDGETYTLPKNDRDHSCLHGGPAGFDHCVWSARYTENTVSFDLVSPDGDEGFPGTLIVSANYVLNDDDALYIDYLATTDAPTPVNMTNHAYFNLGGAGNGNVLDHELTIAAQRYTPVDELLIPTGELAAVDGTPFDFTKPRLVGQDVMSLPGGYDHNFVLADGPRKPALAAVLRDPFSGRAMEVITSEPGLQVYSGHHFDGTLQGNGGTYEQYAGLCLETQHFPDSPNQPAFPNTILRPGAKYASTTIYRFLKS